jgi:diacylglycerol kinase (ATP)
VTRALAIVNPVAGGGRAVRIWERIRPHLDVACIATECAGHASRLAREAAEQAYERVLAVGGDGTVSQVAAGLAGTPTVLAVIPAGNGNDFSRALGVPAAPELAARVALEGRARPVDMGHLQVGGRCVAFVNVAGCGFDAEVLRQTAARRALGGSLLYFGGILRTLTAFRPRPMRLTIDGRVFERRALGIAVANGPTYGGGIRIAPRAILDDGLFDVCLVGDLSPARLLALLPRLYTGTHAGRKEVEFFRCRELTAELLGGDRVTCQADGELLEQLPATFRMQPRRLMCVTSRSE